MTGALIFIAVGYVAYMLVKIYDEQRNKYQAEIDRLEEENRRLRGG